MTTIRWISIDPVLGESKTYQETNHIEHEFQSGKENVYIETFSITINFKQIPFTQTTPPFGTKPKGFRSVVRGNLGDIIIVYLWPNRKWYTTFSPDNISTKQVIIKEIENIPETWQWCDKEYKNVKYALESNWHNFSKENSDQIEEHSKQLRNLTINIGLTPYLISNFESSYGVQKNCVTGVRRVIRRGRSNFISKELPQNLQDESCALCMEEFKDTPHIPTRQTICKHTFHWTCLNNYKSREYTPLCPMCRHIL